MKYLLPHVLFDRLNKWVEHSRFRRVVGGLLVGTFLLAVVAIELKRQQLLPTSVSRLVPGTNHFMAIELTFGMLLIVEGLELIFGLARSVSVAVGKQIEIFSLILLRKSFKEFSGFSEPLEWSDAAIESVGYMMADAFGALLIFAILAIYYRVLRHERFALTEETQSAFIEWKKAIALGLLVAYLGVGVTDCWLWVVEAEDRLIPFFEVFYTMLIFVDILLVLVSLQFSSTYRVAFRNSGFAVATVFLRIAFVAPPYINALLGVGAAVYTLGLTLAYTYFFQSKSHNQDTSTPSESDQELQRSKDSDSVSKEPVDTGGVIYAS
ncbi:MAG: hypothetical protein ACFCD0_03485 [Gemmataceae bacterium]